MVNLMLFPWQLVFVSLWEAQAQVVLEAMYLAYGIKRPVDPSTLEGVYRANEDDILKS